MKLSAKALAVIIAVVLLGGIVLSNTLGWWNTSGGQGGSRGGSGQGQLQNIDNPAAGESHSEEQAAFDGSIRGKTTFQDLLEWGVPLENIETILGSPLPERSLQVSAYCQQQGLSFGRLKRSLQEEVDKIQR
ncbi:MAG: hypothetical protein JXA13_09670 [Anaerolineales bacterium]|nr:hypothetical protein [Anaerolineales bacterium]